VIISLRRGAFRPDAGRSGAFLHLVDFVGDQAMGLAVHGLGCRGGRSLNQAEHLAALLVDPVPPVPDLVLALRLQVAMWALATSSAATPSSNEWIFM